MTDRTACVDEILAIFDHELADRRYSDGVDQRSHALQCAALAERNGAGDALVAASLLHDVGHLLTADRRVPGRRPDEDLRHERLAARHLQRFFGPDVTAPIALHVDAKRYLCAVDPDHLGILSPGSTHSLSLQGGPMTPDEIVAFESEPGWAEATELRRWDDGAKTPGVVCPPLDHYRALLASLL